MKTKRSILFKGLKDGLPIGLGYLSVSFAFGIFAVGQGLLPAEVLLMSMTNLTSAGQFSAVPIIAGGGSFIELAFLQLVINLRYALMSVSLSQKLENGVRVPQRLLISFGVTDEVFGVAISQPDRLPARYFYGLITLPYVGWSVGTLVGALAGNILPPLLMSALGVAIYGMFIAIVLPVVKKSTATMLCVLLALGIRCVFYYLPALQNVPDGFAIIVSAAAASALFAYRDARIAKREGAER